MGEPFQHLRRLHGWRGQSHGDGSQLVREPEAPEAPGSPGAQPAGRAQLQAQGRPCPDGAQARSFLFKPGSLALNLEHVLSVYEEPQEAGQKQQLFSSQKKSRNSSKRRQEASSTRKDFVLSPRSNAVITG